MLRRRWNRCAHRRQTHRAQQRDTPCMGGGHAGGFGGAGWGTLTEPEIPVDRYGGTGVTDRIADIWGERTPHSAGSEWPERVDAYLRPGVSEEDVQRWVPSACLLCSNGCGLDIAVADGEMVGVRGRASDRVNRGRRRTWTATPGCAPPPPRQRSRRASGRRGRCGDHRDLGATAVHRVAGVLPVPSGHGGLGGGEQPAPCTSRSISD